jgi:hypothetical protein
VIWQTGVVYAKEVAKGNVNVCRDVRLACQRFLNQYENHDWRWVFDEDYPQHVLEFATQLRHTKGHQAGQPIVLEPFQIFIICAVYGFRDKKDREKRMVSDVIVYIPRKAGKSTLTALIGLYELFCGEAGAEVYTLATNREQATIVFDAAKGFIDYMPADFGKLFMQSKYEIKKVGDAQSMFKALSRDTKKTGDGKNPSCVIVDEAAQIVDRNSIEVLHSGMVARQNPLRIYITTASFTKDTKFHEDMSMIRSMLNGEAVDNPKWFGLLYGLDPRGALGNRLSIGPRPSEEMPDAVRGHDLSVMFFTDGLSKLGSAPTRLAEVLGCGLPVVANDGVGDVAGIVRKNKVGVIVDGSDPAQMRAALDELKVLMQDPDLPGRCRVTAETVFSLEAGTEAYRGIYASILQAEGNPCVE